MYTLSSNQKRQNSKLGAKKVTLQLSSLAELEVVLCKKIIANKYAMKVNIAWGLVILTYCVLLIQLSATTMYK
jgi:hypothetical protein